MLRVAAETTASAVAKRKKLEIVWSHKHDALLGKYAKLREKFKKLGDAYTFLRTPAKQQVCLACFQILIILFIIFSFHSGESKRCASARL